MTDKENLENIAWVNRVRGGLLNIFIQVEHIMADITVRTKYGGDFALYYKNYKTAKNIVDDFISNYDNNSTVLNKFFRDKQSLESDLQKLVDIRNILAHFQWYQNDSFLATHPPQQEFFLLSCRKGQEECRSLVPQAISDYQKICSTLGAVLSQVQKEISLNLNVPLFSYPADKIPESNQRIVVDELTCLKKP